MLENDNDPLGHEQRNDSKWMGYAIVALAIFFIWLIVDLLIRMP